MTIEEFKKILNEHCFMGDDALGCNKCPLEHDQHCVCTLAQFAKEYINKLEEDNEKLQTKTGLSSELPCYIGDTAYVIIGVNPIIMEYEITSIEIEKNSVWFNMQNKSFGLRITLPLSSYTKTWFNDKQKAEQKLNKRRRLKV